MNFLHRIIQRRAFALSRYICRAVVKFVVHAVLLFIPVSKGSESLYAEAHISVHLPVHFASVGRFKINRISRQLSHSHSLSHGVEFTIELLGYFIENSEIAQVRIENIIFARHARFGVLADRIRVHTNSVATRPLAELS